jgi:hypothetical protein
VLNHAAKDKRTQERINGRACGCVGCQTSRDRTGGQYGAGLKRSASSSCVRRTRAEPGPHLIPIVPRRPYVTVRNLRIHRLDFETTEIGAQRRVRSLSAIRLTWCAQNIRRSEWRCRRRCGGVNRALTGRYARGAVSGLAFTLRSQQRNPGRLTDLERPGVSVSISGDSVRRPSGRAEMTAQQDCRQRRNDVFKRV